MQLPNSGSREAESLVYTIKMRTRIFGCQLLEQSYNLVINQFLR